MLIKEIEVENFNNFKDCNHFKISKLNIIKGNNGSGKSTIGLDSILFAIYGYTDKTISELVCRFSNKKSCRVKITLDYKNKEYIIERKYPTSINIWLNKQEVQLDTNALKQKYLNDIFKDVDYFRKFRMLDVKQGINILEQGKVSLKKTLLSFHESMFNNIRKRLQDKKREREIYNKDTARILPHYPSERRYDIIAEGLSNSMVESTKIQTEKQDIHKELINSNSKLATIKNQIHNLEKQIYNLKKLNNCPTCLQNVPKEHKEKIILEWQDHIKSLSNTLEAIKKEYEDITEQHTLYQKQLEIVSRKQMMLHYLKTRLENRLNQKDYRFSNKDVLIISESIKELDKFCSYYITEWIKGLETIINSITSKLSLEIHFDLDIKNNFDIKIFKKNIEYSYKDLSDGQKLILTTAFQIALLIQQNEDGLIVADEGFSSLDDNNLKHIFNLFEDLPFQLICILHRSPELQDSIHIIELGNNNG